MVSAQPSTSTNSSSLNGIETIVGESIIMPSDIRVEETTRSMIRKGRKIRKPIWKAVLSSLVTKAGSRIVKGTACGDARIAACRPSRRTACRSVSRVWRIMKPCSTVPERRDRLLDADLAVAIGRVGGRVHLIDHRPHHEQRQEEREADQHLVGRRLLQADRLAQDRKDDDDPGEAGHHQQDRRQHRQQAHQQQDLQASESGRPSPAIVPSARSSAPGWPPVGAAGGAGAGTPVAGLRVGDVRQEEQQRGDRAEEEGDEQPRPRKRRSSIGRRPRRAASRRLRR